MCIIVAKRRGVAMPSMETMYNCFVNNDDGAGYMYNHEGKVYGRKGFMTFEDFRDDLIAVEQQVGSFEDKGVVLHFRIGTHGTNNQENTHPFPLTSDYKQMKELRWESNQGFAHNGIITATSRHVDVNKKNVSDTMVFNKYYISPVSRHVDLSKDIDLLDMFKLLSNGKLAFLNGKGVISTCGDFVEREGILYSNYTFNMYVYSGYSIYSSPWDDDYDTYNDWKDDYIGSFMSSATSEMEMDEDSLQIIREYAADDVDVSIFHHPVILEYLDNGVVKEEFILCRDNYGYQRETGDIYSWDGRDYTWKYAYTSENLRVRNYITGEIVLVIEK